MFKIKDYNPLKLKEQASTSVLIVCSSHRSRSVYICNMQHWQVLQLRSISMHTSAAVPATITATMAAVTSPLPHGK